MATITTRSGKGSPLTNTEVDDNFTNLNTAKYESGDSPEFSAVLVDNGATPVLTLKDSGNGGGGGYTGYVEFASTAGTSFRIGDWESANQTGGPDILRLWGANSTQMVAQFGADGTSQGEFIVRSGSLYANEVIAANYIGEPTGFVQLGGIANEGANGYVRGNIYIGRDRDLVTWDDTADNWVHAGGGSSDWSLITHTASYGLSFYTGPGDSAGFSKSNVTFRADHLAIEIGSDRSVELTNGLNLSAGHFSMGGTNVIKDDRSIVNATGLSLSHSTSEGVLITATDSDNTSTFYAVKIDHNASGDTQQTSSSNHMGLMIDVDSSATGGDTTYEHRLYGLHSDVRASGDSDILYSVYGYAENQHNSGTNTVTAGGYFYAQADYTGDGGASSLYGVQALAYMYADGAGTLANAYGGYFKALHSATMTSDVNYIHGVYAEVEIDPDTAGNTSVGSVYVTRAILDNDAGTGVQLTNGFLFHGSYTGTFPTNAYGIYISSDVMNHFAGSIRTRNWFAVENSSDTQLRWLMETNLDSDYAVQRMYGKDGAETGFLIGYGSSHGTTPNMLALKAANTNGSIGFFTSATERARVTDAGLNVDGTITGNNVLVIDGLDTNNPSAASEQLRLSGYGLLGNRGTLYITNGGGGDIKFGTGSTHNAQNVMSVSSTNVAVDTKLTLTGDLELTPTGVATSTDTNKPSYALKLSARGWDTNGNNSPTVPWYVQAESTPSVYPEMQLCFYEQDPSYNHKKFELHGEGSGGNYQSPNSASFYGNVTINRTIGNNEGGTLNITNGNINLSGELRVDAGITTTTNDLFIGVDNDASSNNSQIRFRTDGVDRMILNNNDVYIQDNLYLGRTRNGTTDTYISGEQILVMYGDTGAGRLLFRSPYGTDADKSIMHFTSDTSAYAGADFVAGTYNNRFKVDQAGAVQSGGYMWIGRVETDSAAPSSTYFVGETGLTVYASKLTGVTTTNPSNSANGGYTYIYSRHTADGSACVYASVNGTVRFQALANGNLNYGGSISQISDGRLKTDITPARPQWDDIKALNIVNFRWSNPEEDQAPRIGVIAQELEAAGMGGLVFESPELNPDFDDRTDPREAQWLYEDDGVTVKSTKTVKTDVMLYKAIKALQEAMTRIEDLEAEVAALKGA